MKEIVKFFGFLNNLIYKLGGTPNVFYRFLVAFVFLDG